MKNSPEFIKKRFKVPPRYDDISWSDMTSIVPSDRQLAKDYVESFPVKKGLNSLYISHKTSGTGKTAYSICLANDLIDSGKLNTYVLFLPFNLFIDQLRQDRGAFSDSKLFQKIKKASLLIFDDIGVENLNRSVAERYYLILDQIWSYKIPSIFTSKFSLNELVNRASLEVEEELMTSIASRLVGMCQKIQLSNGEDHRVR